MGIDRNMPLKAIPTFFLLLLILCWMAYSQDSSRLTRGNALFALAEQQYNSEQPGPVSDSIALLYYQKAIEVYQGDGMVHSNAIHAFIKRGNILQGQRKFGEALPEYHYALGLCDQSSKFHLQAYLAQLNLGSNYYYSYKIDSARFYLEKASEMAQADSSLPDQDVLYNSLGAMYLQSANYLQAKNYFSKALLLLDPQSPEYRETFSGFSNNIAYCMMLLDDHAGALSLYRKLLPDPYLHNRVLQNIGHAYYDMGNFDSAMHFFNRVEVMENNATVRMLQEMGRIDLARGNIPKARSLIDSSLAINQRISGSPRERSVGFLLRAMASRQEQDTRQALVFIEEGLKGINETNAPVTLFDLLEQKAALQVAGFQHNGDSSLLRHGIKNYLAAIDLANYIRDNFDMDEAKLFFNRNQRSLYLHAADAVYQQYELTRSPDCLEDYLFIEESLKGTVLRENLRKNRFKMSAGIDPQLLKREDELKQSLAYYTTVIDAGTDSAALAELEKERVSVVVALSRLQKQFEAYPGYHLYHARREQQAKLMDSVRGVMGKGHAIVSYLSLDSAYLCLVVRNKDATLFRIPTDSGNHVAARNFITSLHHLQEGSRYNGNVYGKEIFNTLVNPVWEFCREDKSWTIITDGLLNYIPFEALPVSDRPADYLALHKQTGYHYSFSLLLSNKAPQLSTSNAGAWETIAPYATTDSNIRQTGLPALAYTTGEAGTEKSLTYTGATATKQFFLSHAAKAGVMHIATHAAAGGNGQEDAWISFYPSNPDSLIGYRLFLDEVYPLKLDHTELVILSACETALGNLSVGEGLLSLSRAFLYAGAKGVVASLWRSEDRVTAYLIRRMRLELEKGKPVEAALQEARMSLLNDASIPPSLKSPNYWSHLIYIGGTTTARDIVLWPWVLGAAILLALVFFFRRSFTR